MAAGCGQLLGLLNKLVEARVGGKKEWVWEEGVDPATMAHAGTNDLFQDAFVPPASQTHSLFLPTSFLLLSQLMFKETHY